MGAVAESALRAGGKVHGVIPKALAVEGRLKNGAGAPVEAAAEGNKSGEGEGKGKSFLDAADTHGGRFTTEVVQSMHEVSPAFSERRPRLIYANLLAISTQRKTCMAQLATGGFIVLPGGFGTFEEVMEMTTWNQVRAWSVCDRSHPLTR